MVGPSGMRLSEESRVAGVAVLEALRRELPLRHRQSAWRLVYSTARHGMSLKTLFRCTDARAPTVMLIRDMKGHVFGSYVSASWQVQHRYYGDGETMVFSLHPEPVVFKWDRASEGNNQFFQFGQPDCIALGGGGGFAIRIDGDLKFGSSRPSATFRNPTLSSAEEFMVETLELGWVTSPA